MSTQRGSPSRPVRTVAPVVVSPEVDSKSASTGVIPRAVIRGQAPRVLKSSQKRVTIR